MRILWICLLLNGCAWLMEPMPYHGGGGPGAVPHALVAPELPTTIIVIRKRVE